MNQKLKSSIFTSALSLLGVGIGLVSCHSGSANQPGSQDSTAASASTSGSGNGKSLIGAGSTFVYPLFSKMFEAYNQQTGVMVNYQSIGSGGGIKQLQNETVDFGASDAPMNAGETSKSPGVVLHIPDCLGAVVITYNLPGKPVLKFNSAILSGIYLGKITQWNDKAITALNPGIKLPNLQISVIHRAEASGTTYIFSDYLSKVSPVWKVKPGTGKSLDWPVGLGGKGNEGVSGLIQQTPGAIGYVELAYALQNSMPAALLLNKSGNFVGPTLASTSAAANINNMPADLKVSITDTDAPDGYPICSFSYLLLYQNQSYDNRSEAQGKATVDLAAWIIQGGQQYSEALEYAKLPGAVVSKSLDLLKTVTFNNKPLL
ncbi:MAG TPA: phosphate ABC transporter substrate-binding protein PstS [Chitinophagaceae bacterium]|nr:phosphate ABC transporter substrate-binding protein PstS [Chitinophagaceae bacterium]